MYIVKTISDVEAIKGNLSADVTKELKRVAEILDESYNSCGADGGFIIVIADKADLEEAKRYLDYTSEPIEYMVRLNGYISVLFLPATEYSITMIFPVDIAPKEVLEQGENNG